MKNRFFHIKLVSALLIFLFFMLGLIRNQAGRQLDQSFYARATIAYSEGKTGEALTGFEAALKQDPYLPAKEPFFNFRYAYALLKAQRWNEADTRFSLVVDRLEKAADYALYFQAASRFNRGDSSGAWENIYKIREEFPNSILVAWTDSLLAEHFMALNSPDSALYYLKRTLDSGWFERTGIYLKIIRLLEHRDNTERLRANIFYFLKVYPYHERSSSLYTQILQTYPNKIPRADLEKLLNYLFATDQFLGAEKLVSSQQKYAGTSAEKDYFNWLPVEMSYRQGEIRRVLNWCLSKRKYFKSPSIRRDIDLHIARCYLRLGSVKKSIDAYKRFQKRYPLDGLAPEVLWKIAWLYEDLSDIHKSIQAYQTLIRSYPRSQFVDEAEFRMGLNYYRLHEYPKARAAWNNGIRGSSSQIEKDRFMYWIAKSYGEEQQYRKQGEIYLALAAHPISSYYSMKAFYLTDDGGDLHHHHLETFWQLHTRDYSYFSKYISKFDRALLVRDLLGKKWSDRELQTIRIDAGDWKTRFALGELYERMNNYGDAYRVFRSIFNAKFSDAELEDMIPVFKKLYPFYYTAAVDSASARWGVQPALILSVMKKESAFENHIISYANAYGLMQLLPNTASQIAARLHQSFTSASQLFDPELNIRMGTHYLAFLLKRYNGSLVKTLAAYNAGPHRVDRWEKLYRDADEDLFMENIEFEQTRVYVRTVLKYYWVYLSIMDPDRIPDGVLTYARQLTHNTR